MKKILSLILAFVCLGFYACDNLEEDEYREALVGETQLSTPITEHQTEQYVLLEDYTGWMCVNCPTAAQLLEDLMETYGDRLITMSVHAGTFANPNNENNNLDLRTEYGTKWNTEFGFTSYPAGMVNRTFNGSSRIFQKDEWSNAIANVLASQKHLINIDLGVRTEGQDLIVSVDYKAVETFTNGFYANVVVIESDIHGVQYNTNPACGSVPKITDYQFNHVLRTNGRIELPCSSNGMQQGETIHKNYIINCSPKWNLDNCKVVVFLTDTQSGEILQANEIPSGVLDQ